ncbi:MAG TPA: TerC family protein [Fimbriimonadaceae bacterium]|nr:TerC family protein [Fimbriimonadaceae bacterium]HRJ96989.1 TerC family protein [Fimbriimonadaceae bacterium]
MELAGIPLWIWGGFLGFVLLMLALDLGVFHRQAHRIAIKEALVWSGIWIGLALAFNALIFASWDRIQPGSDYTNSEAGFAFLAGYLIEKALSVDNIFVFLLIFGYFAVPDKYQHRVLFWGILGALFFRALFIAAGATLLERFHWTMILFGVFLIFTGIKMVTQQHKTLDPERNPFVRLIRRVMPVTEQYDGQRFFTRVGGKLWATPLFLVLLVVEFTDIIFAVDSIPAIFAITSDPFIVFTSNVFAILGLRALFFALAGLMQMFHYLSYGLSAILVFVGLKMLYGYGEKSVFPDWPKFPVFLSLGVIAAILGAAIVLSIRRPPEPETTGA